MEYGFSCKNGKLLLISLFKLEIHADPRTSAADQQLFSLFVKRCSFYCLVVLYTFCIFTRHFKLFAKLGFYGPTYYFSLLLILQYSCIKEEQLYLNPELESSMTVLF